MAAKTTRETPLTPSSSIKKKPRVVDEYDEPDQSEPEVMVFFPNLLVGESPERRGSLLPRSKKILMVLTDGNMNMATEYYDWSAHYL